MLLLAPEIDVTRPLTVSPTHTSLQNEHFIFSEMQDGSTPLSLACERGNARAVRQLVARDGADINSTARVGCLTERTLHVLSRYREASLHSAVRTTTADPRSSAFCSLRPLSTSTTSFRMYAAPSPCCVRINIQRPAALFLALLSLQKQRATLLHWACDRDDVRKMHNHVIVPFSLSTWLCVFVARYGDSAHRTSVVELQILRKLNSSRTPSLCVRKRIAQRARALSRAVPGQGCGIDPRKGTERFVRLLRHL